MQHYKILIVDDEAKNIHTIVEILEQELVNYSFLHATTGKLACTIVENEKPDLILLDWDMPEMNGLDVIRCMKADENTKDIPIIMVTGVMTESKHLKTALAAGAIDFIRKPVDATELLARINSVLEMYKYQQQVLGAKDRELALHAMYITQINKFHIDLLKKINQLSKIETIKQDEFDEIVNSMFDGVEHYIINDSWTRFKTFFEQTHPDFEKRLTQQFPGLTPSELRLCVLLRLNLSSKEIAQVTNLNENTIKTARYRLRKKLDIQDEKLTTFLASL